MKTALQVLEHHMDGLDENEAMRISRAKLLIITAMKEYATEAIKADRERVVNIKIDHGDSFILPKYEKNCILNLSIELP